MLFLICDNLMVPFTKELFEVYKPSSRARVDKRTSITDALALYKKPPLFNDGWLLTFDAKPKVSFVTRMEKEASNNRLVIFAKNVTDLQEMAVEFEDLKPTVIDNSKVEDHEIRKWIEEELKCPSTITDAILKRTHGRLRDTMNAVQTLSVFDNVTLSDVYKHVLYSRNISVNDVVDWLLGVQKSSISQRDIMQFIDDFRYAQFWLLTTLISSLEIYRKVFMYACAGELNLTNYEQFCEITDDKEIKAVPKYRIKKILSVFGEVSLEYVVFIQAKLTKLSKKDKLALFRLSQLIRLGGNL